MTIDEEWEAAAVIWKLQGLTTVNDIACGRYVEVYDLDAKLNKDKAAEKELGTWATNLIDRLVVLGFKL